MGTGQFVKTKDGLAFQDEFGIVRDQVMKAISDHVDYFQGNVVKVREPFTPDTPLPRLIVQRSRKSASMDGTNRFNAVFTFTVWWDIVNNDLQVLEQSVGEMAEALERLFSNNGLGDLGTPPNGGTRQFMSNNPYWYEARFNNVELTPPLTTEVFKDMFLMMGRAQLTVKSWITKGAFPS